MKAPRLAIATLLASIPVFTLVSCAQIGDALAPLGLTGDAGPPLEADVAEVQAIHQEVEASWVEIETRVGAVEKDVAGFGPSPMLVQARHVDLGHVKDGILHSTELNVTEAGATKVQTVDVGGAYQGVDAATRAEVGQVQADGQRIMVELKQGIPSSMADLTTESTKALASAKAIQLKARNAEKVAAKNPLMSDANLETLRANQKRIDFEVQRLEALAQKIANEGTGVSDRMSRALTQFQGKVSALK